MAEDLPDFKKGIDYWTAVDATVDGVLGGFGEGVRSLGRLPPYLNRTDTSLLNMSSLFPVWNNFHPVSSCSPL